MLRGLLLMIALLAPATVCLAQEPGNRDEEARSLFEAGATAFEAGRYEDALRRFRESYELSGRVALLFNIANAADRMRHDSEALEAYQRYVEAQPDGPHADIARERIAFLQAQGPDAPPDGPDLSATDTDEGGGGSVAEEWWFWTLIGVLVVGAGVGIALGVVLGSDGQVEDPLPGTVGGVIFTLEGS